MSAVSKYVSSLKTAGYLLSMILIVECHNKVAPKNFDEYDPLIWSAMIAYEDQEYDKSLALFEKAFNVIPDDSANDIFHAASAAFRLERDDVAEKLIRRAISKTNPNREYYYSFQGFSSFRKNQIFASVENDYDQLVADYYNHLPYPEAVEDEIVELVRKDQEVRKNKEWDAMAQVDSLNIACLIGITAEYGWIDKAWILLWHQRGSHKEDNDTWNYFRPFINRAIEKGQIRKGFWALFDDEQSISESNLQIFGMYQNQFPVKDIETIDERRKDVGLPPLWYLNKVYDQELPDGYEYKIKG